MNPRTVLWQAAVFAVLAVALSWVVGATAGLVVIVVVVLVVGLLNGGYAWALGSQGRPERRVAGDRLVSTYLAAATAVPAVAITGLSIAGHDPTATAWKFTDAEVDALAFSPALLFAVVLCSSAVDWYYIRPRIDGIVRQPACRSSGDGIWKRTTRRWYLHRGIATLTYILFALAVAFVVMSMLLREEPTAAGLIGGVGGLAGLLLIFVGPYRSQIPTVAKFVLSPAFCLGDDLTYEAHRWKGRGYVLHVSVPVAKLVPLDEHGRRTAIPFVERKNTDLADSDLISVPTRACAGACVLLNPECAFELLRVDARSRRFIL
jgi:hypothetical protein